MIFTTKLIDHRKPPEPRPMTNPRTSHGALEALGRFCIAAMTHLDEKLDLLKNVLVRLAVDTDSDDFLALQMLRFVDTLTPEHFLVLRYCSDPEGWFDARGIGRPSTYMGSPNHIMQDARLPVVGTSRDIVLRDLSDFGLANTESLRTMMTEPEMWRPLATDLGGALLDFVSQTDRD